MRTAGTELGGRPDGLLLDEPHPTAMIERPGPVMRWFFGRFFRPIEFPAEIADKIRTASERGIVVYVVKTLSYIEYLYFTFAFLKLGLPLSRFANGVKTLLMQPLGRVVRGLFGVWRRRRESHVAEMAQVVRSGQSALLFLKRPHTLFGWEPAGFRGAYVEELIRVQRERPRPIVFVPLTLLWGAPVVRAAKHKRGLLDVVFGEREAPGRLRAMLGFFRHYRDSKVIASQPLDLVEFLRDEGPDASDEVLARRLRWHLAGRLESEMRVVLGPVRKGARRLREEVLRSRKLIAEGQAIARSEGLTPQTVLKRARAALKEIAAEPKPWMFAFAWPLLSWVWRRIFDGIEVDRAGLARLREAARRGPLVLVPSHKSHIDYLVLSYVFIAHDLVPPHIAAGANLSFWPLGFFFRRGGAFFLRRSFRGDKLYASVFRAYVRKLMRENTNLEFFIEGGRSRTGKLQSPKLGLLAMIVEAALDDDGAHARRAQVVPISIGYEKVIEEKSYARELAGGEKKAEDMKGLLKATKVLRGHYGRLNIQFDEPFPLIDALRDAGALVAWDEEANVVVSADESARRHAIQRLAHRIVYGINQVTAVTPTALVASALLATGKRGVTRRELAEQARFLLDHARAVGGRVSESVLDAQTGGLSIDALDRSLDLLAHDGDLEIRSGGDSIAEGARQDEIYTIPDERRPRLAYYRNNALHLFVADALVALGLLGASSARGGAEQPISKELVRARTLTLSRLLKLEFSYRVGERFEQIFDGTVARLVERGLIATDVVGDSAPALRAAGPGRLQVLAGQVRDFVESYLIAARALEGLRGAHTDKDLVRRIQTRGEKLFYTGEVRRREACASANYQNAVAYFKERGVLVEEERKLRLASGADVRKLTAEIAELLPSE